MANATKADANTVRLWRDRESGYWTARIGPDSQDRHCQAGGSSGVEAMSALTVALHHLVWAFDPDAPGPGEADDVGTMPAPAPEPAAEGGEA